MLTGKYVLIINYLEIPTKVHFSSVFDNANFGIILVAEEGQEYQLVVKEAHLQLMMKVGAVLEVVTRDQVQLL